MVTRPVILRNPFVFLALFLALVLKERGVSTLSVFMQNHILKTYGFVKDSTTLAIELSPQHAATLPKQEF